MDEIGVYYTERSNSERKTPIQYINAYKIVTMTLYERQQKKHDVKNRLLDSVGEGEGGMI